MDYLRLMFLGLSALAVILTLLNGYYNRKSNEFKAPAIARHGIRMDIEKRNRMVRTFCTRHKHDRPLSKRSFLKSRKLYVDDKLKFIYCHMPKIASTTWLELLMPLNDGFKKSILYVHEESHVLSLANYTTKQALHRVRTYFKFVFVRDPFERLLSAYKDKLRSKSTRYYSKVYAARTAAKTRGRNSSEQKTGTGTSTTNVRFPELLKYLSSKSERGARGMWGSVRNHCQPCLMNYDFIGHYETFGRDARYVLARLGIQKTFPAWKPGDTSSLAKDYYEQLSKEERKIIYEITKDDNEMFGYTPQ